MKKPKTSLNCEPTHSLYSSLPKVNSKRKLSPVGMISNSNLQASCVLRPVTASSKGSPGVFWANQVPLPVLLFGPSASSMRPEVRITPSVMFIPAHFVRSIKVSYAGRKVFDADLDFSISENPTLRFNFVPRGQGVLKAEVEDSKDGRWEGTLSVQ